uniref:Uncharacterized protein n=1 Tax=Plectus sambesii TaxID=2011161 RepID=A0A914V8C7_9BILA
MSDRLSTKAAPRSVRCERHLEYGRVLFIADAWRSFFLMTRLAAVVLRRFVCDRYVDDKSDACSVVTRPSFNVSIAPTVRQRRVVGSGAHKGRGERGRVVGAAEMDGEERGRREKGEEESQKNTSVDGRNRPRPRSLHA